jgi:hypothetical protein
MSRLSLLPIGLLASLVVTGRGESIDGILPPFYSGKEIQATVVGAETGQPIDGAVVVVVWELKAMSGRGPRLNVSEVLTDAQGAFATQGWGPKPRPPLNHAASHSPFLVVFKSGYVPVRLRNASKRDFPRLRAMSNLTADQITYRIPNYDGNPYDIVQESLWDGMAIRIAPFRGTPEEWFRSLDHISAAIPWEDAKRAQRFYEALSREREYFKTHPLDPGKVSRAVFESVFGGIDNRLKIGRER